ncbi:MAG: hypothetical protein OHK0039_10840 [Bacteroidia bacterium]
MPEDEELHRVFPLFRRWRSLYLFVLVESAVVILLLYLFSRAYT